MTESESACVFCEILKGTEPSSVVYRDDRCVAFLDIKPINPGHVLVVPSEHGAGLSDVSEESAAHMMRVSRKVATALQASGVRCEGVNLFLSDGRAAFQDVFHVHMHVIPRWQGDGFGLRFSDQYHLRTTREALEDTAARIKSAIE
ncbi:MAG TPA: HIT family protein [Gemmatimonadaceae bacterium]|nr:HIT family protein [Gemmatimonadaceae bacterium]